MGYHSIPQPEWKEIRDTETGEQAKVPVFYPIQFDPDNELNRVYFSLVSHA